MKMLLLVFLVFFIHSVSASDRLEFNKTITVSISDNLLFNTTIEYEFEKTLYSDDEWWMTLSKDLEEVVFYDSKGVIPIKRVLFNDSSYATYLINVRHQKTNPSEKSQRRLWINASGSLTKLTPYLSTLYFYSNYFWDPSLYNETLNIRIQYPSKIKPVTFITKNILNKEVGETTFTYTSFRAPGGLFVEFTSTEKDKFIKKIINDKTFYVENDSLVIEAFEKASQHFPLIPGWLSSKPANLIIVKRDLGEGFLSGDDVSGFYGPDNLIALDKSLLTSEEMATVLLHELTHYVFKEKENYESHIPYWVNEGFAVLTSSRYLDQEFSQFKGALPSTQFLSPFDVKPRRELLDRWYAKRETNFLSLINKSNFTIGELYPIYAYILGNYADKYGQDALEAALAESIVNSQVLENKLGYFLMNIEIERTFLNSLRAKSPAGVDTSQIFFPDSELYDKDKESFFVQKSKFISHPITIERINEYIRNKKIIVPIPSKKT